MGIKLYVGNLSYNTTQDELSTYFADFGTVASVKVITDRDTGRSKGFAFVEMDDTAEGKMAIEKANGQELNGRAMNISEAKPQEQRPRTGGGFGGGGGSSRGPKRW